MLKSRNSLATSDISLIFAPGKVLNIRIMRTFNYNEIQNTPIWNEVKNWSDDRKNALITLLYSTMKGINPYEVPEDKVQAFVNDMPHEVLEMASESPLRKVVREEAYLILWQWKRLKSKEDGEIINIMVIAHLPNTRIFKIR